MGVLLMLPLLDTVLSVSIRHSTATKIQLLDRGSSVTNIKRSAISSVKSLGGS